MRIDPLQFLRALTGGAAPKPKPAPKAKPVPKAKLAPKPKAELESLVFDVLHAGVTYQVSVKSRESARRFTLRVSTVTGEIILTMPPRASLAAARIFADSHGGWIAARMAQRPARVVFRSGEMVPVRGIPHRIVHWTHVSSAARATHDANGEPIIAVAGSQAHLSRRVTDFLKREARRDLDAAVVKHTTALGMPARKVTLRDTRSRWGSCNARGHLNFSWRLILAPPLVLDYVAAHEVAHLKELNHSSRFWAVTGKLFPRVQEAERWLKRHGAELHRYG
jgi:predicted metal-dependent hydrolase